MNGIFLTVDNQGILVQHELPELNEHGAHVLEDLFDWDYAHVISCDALTKKKRAVLLKLTVRPPADIDPKKNKPLVYQYECLEESDVAQIVRVVSQGLRMLDSG